jgi:histidine triad (HIT) family protein
MVMTKDKTIFSKIVSGEIPAVKVYEDNLSLAFLDINPVAKGHTLIITKEPYVWMQDVPNELLSHIFIKTKDLMSVIKGAVGCDFVQIVVEGKDVPHFHIHIIPGYFEHKSAVWEHVKYEDGEMDDFAEKIRSGIKS